MKKYFSVVVLCMLVMPALGAGRSMVPGVKSSVSTIQRMPTLSTMKIGAVTSSGKIINSNFVDSDAGVDSNATTDAVNLEKERLACLNNNIGVGNTFVWASKNSNAANYASMVEDVENPDNNVCYVLVGMRSEDSRISTADIQPQYFKWGDTITCGSWVDEAKMENRILDAKQTARTWATVGGAVGGAGVGVGAMELFGNRLLGKTEAFKSVQGQEALDMYSVEWYKSKINENTKKGNIDYTNFEALVAQLVTECDKANPDARCNDDKYKGLIGWYKETH